MSTYVDASVWPYRGMLMCHLLGDTEDELHAMAAAVGVARRHFQNKPGGMPHYDICKSKRAKAVKLGAVECDRWQIANVMRRLKGQALLPNVPDPRPLRQKSLLALDADPETAADQQQGREDDQHEPDRPEDGRSPDGGQQQAPEPPDERDHDHGDENLEQETESVGDHAAP